MGRAKALIFFSIAIIVAACSGSDSETDLKNLAAAAKMPFRPNILWLVAEDLSPIIPPFGDNTVVTPYLSRLAAEGVRYTQVFSSSGVCAPSRAAIATGMYQNRIGAQHMRTSGLAGFAPDGFVPYEAVPPADVKMHSQYFREAGYYTSNNAKEDYQFKAPVMAWDDSSAQAHWRNRADGQPFFSVFNFGITHESQVWAQADKPLLVDSNLDVPIPPYLPDTDIAKQDIRQVYSNIVAMDKQVGEILDQLEEDGLLEQTIIFWYTDHGGPLPRQKRLLYDSGIRLPLIVRFPNQHRAGETDSQIVSFVDFKSTILSLVDIEPPNYVDGRAFLGAYENSVPRRYFHAAADRFDSQYDMIRAVGDGRFKYLRNFDPEKPYYLPLRYREQMPVMQELLQMRDKGELDEFQSQWFRENKDEEELFDVENDPHELNNLAADPAYADKLLELRTEMNRWMTEIDDKGLMPESEYIESVWPDKVQPETAPIDFALNRGGLTLSSATEGAALGYQIVSEGEGLSESWQVYVEPIEFGPGDTVYGIAHRIGYKQSEPRVFEFAVTD